MSAPVQAQEGADVASVVGMELEALTPQEVKEINLRAMHRVGTGTEELHKSLFIPKSHPLDLFFFRSVFKYMIREMHQPHDSIQSSAQGPSGEDTSKSGDDTSMVTTTKSGLFPQSPREEAEKDQIPVAAFQRTLERLFYILRDPDGFNAADYDVDGNGYVGWSEFVHVYQKRNICICLSPLERIFHTMTNPDTSRMAFLISCIVLLVIATSSSCFILGTIPEWKDEPIGDEPPQTKAIFKTIEHTCLAIFVVEYLSRLLTCWAVRTEVFDTKRLMEMTISYERIRLPSPGLRLFKFITQPNNLIDLCAILPGVIEWFGVQISGGGFVVLRLIRLTRILRAPAVREPAMVIARTIKRSTKALGVLVFNLGLGIVIFGSLMYLFERGTWDPETRMWMRPIVAPGSESWNANISRYETVLDRSDFQSIPHTFWWAIVTATTVGYGDDYPTTSEGYVIAVATMMFSLVIAALPVGVIGGNFAQVWEEQENDKTTQMNAKKKEAGKIKESFQRFLAYDTMSSLMLIDVWNERFPPEEAWQAQHEKRPLKGEFMGCVRLELPFHDKRDGREARDRPRWKEAFDEEMTLPLVSDPDVVPRKVTGTLTVRCKWTPDPLKDNSETKLAGELTLTIISAKNLINLNLRKADAMSNPFCMAVCYPKSNQFDDKNPAFCLGLVSPVIWRAPPEKNTLDPVWNSSHTFKYAWYETSKQHKNSSSAKLNQEPKGPQPPGVVPPKVMQVTDAPQGKNETSPPATEPEAADISREEVGTMGSPASNGAMS